jgi:cell division FtsZ-interacting protein ZapD
MNDMSGVDRAVKRVLDALDALDAAMELRLDDDRKRGSLTEQVHVFNIDRSRLAAELDGAQARARQLETTNREAARRIDEAMSAIRAVIAANQS